MRWKGRKGSTNIEDRRGKSSSRGGGGFRMPGGRMPKMGAGAGIIAILIVGAILLFGPEDGGQIGEVIQTIGNSQGNSRTDNSAPTGGPVTTNNAAEDELAQFVSVVLADCEEVWKKIFRQAGSRYKDPVLVLFSGSTPSPCGYASAATGPFYCPADEKIYIDLSFFRELKTKFGAPGDFAMAYVVAHEVGHHVQNLLGTSSEVHRQKRRLSKAAYNELSVKLELQADYYAGLWAHHAQQMNDILEKGDIEEALRAAKAIGDDNIQKRSQGYVVPESFTHGTSAQRARWFRKGFQYGTLRDGDTFSARTL